MLKILRLTVRSSYTADVKKTIVIGRKQITKLPTAMDKVFAALASRADDESGTVMFGQNFFYGVEECITETINVKS